MPRDTWRGSHKPKRPANGVEGHYEPETERERAESFLEIAAGMRLWKQYLKETQHFTEAPHRAEAPLRAEAPPRASKLPLTSCPECQCPVAVKNLARHRRRVHGTVST